jgi:hypothetical protein
VFDSGTNTCTTFAAGTEGLNTTSDGSFVKDFFQNTTTTCPAGERGTAYPATLVCGPNFHTDITASDSASLNASAFLQEAADGNISIVVTPTVDPTGGNAGVGRLKIFDVELQFSGDVTAPIPEPSTLVLFGVSIVGVALTRRRYGLFASRAMRDDASETP